MTNINNLEMLDEGNEILKNLVSSIYQSGDSNFYKNFIISKATAVGTTASVFGLASLIGTASTGTAIGTLSGAAATNATLAWIGGSIFTGTIVLAGGAIASSYVAVKLFNGKIRKTEELNEVEKETITACLSFIKAIEDEKTQRNNISDKEVKILYENVFMPLVNKIYKHNEEISSQLNVKFKLAWRKNRLKLIAYSRKLALFEQ